MCFFRLVLPFERHLKGEEDKPLPPSKPRKPYKRSLNSKLNKPEKKRKRSQLESETDSEVRFCNTSQKKTRFKWVIHVEFIPCYFIDTSPAKSRSCLSEWSSNASSPCPLEIWSTPSRQRSHKKSQEHYHLYSPCPGPHIQPLVSSCPTCCRRSHLPSGEKEANGSGQSERTPESPEWGQRKTFRYSLLSISPSILFQPQLQLFWWLSTAFILLLFPQPLPLLRVLRGRSWKDWG